ncbi:cryptochrome/photolyase family protein [Streptomyces radicis]|uniref:Deoxyribodipyrimidine photo-lyase n=1 Tax=Streptomyces radicis TaxID=1750517 RepID=A0A3A9W2Q9_9ACTN|nr:deoxyribodipyrimidine photo-lyase [Streptomyces radicis]RKN07190.1 deoxyribodipyrimidine photo-lyase [Streptomyces radicis]RKN26791.1 deoxyribodipyrimidine photo-lyase [Streptomyces radicis]
MSDVAVALFTSDLRVHDNPMLRAALREAERVVPLFVVDSGIARTGFPAPNRAAFLADCLADLDASLRDRGGRLVVARGDVVAETCRVAEATGAATVHLAAGVSGYATRRERRLRAALAEAGRGLTVHEASLTAVPPGALTPGGRGKDRFVVFTPYFRRWDVESLRAVRGAPRVVRIPDVRSAPLPTPGELAPGEASPALPRGGENEARRRLRAWERGPLDRYAERHDAPGAEDGTSRLSPYLHFGCVSPVELVSRARKRGGDGAEAFVRQLAWRDFYHQMLAARPNSSWEDFRYRRRTGWRDDPAGVAAWRDGRTGFPIIDAAMRQLRHEGWMHNRARLLVASFLTKTLDVDWRVGARYFLDLLVDGDLANNQLNWQWAAGTGTDTRPNRVLNPLTQALRHDRGGPFVRRWVPELAALRGSAVHRPWRVPERLDYPAPIVQPPD